MGISLLKVLPGVLKAAAKVLGLDIGKAVEAIVGEQLTPEQQSALNLAMLDHEIAMKQIGLDELKTVLSETQLMLSSEDKYVSRARPTGLYIAYACSVAMTIALVTGTAVDAAAILTLMAPLYGAQGYYMHLRTREKMNGNGHGG